MKKQGSFTDSDWVFGQEKNKHFNIFKNQQACKQVVESLLNYPLTISETEHIFKEKKVVNTAF